MKTTDLLTTPSIALSSATSSTSPSLDDTTATPAFTDILDKQTTTPTPQQNSPNRSNPLPSATAETISHPTAPTPILSSPHLKAFSVSAKNTPPSGVSKATVQLDQLSDLTPSPAAPQTPKLQSKTSPKSEKKSEQTDTSATTTPNADGNQIAQALTANLLPSTSSSPTTPSSPGLFFSSGLTAGQSMLSAQGLGKEKTSSGSTAPSQKSSAKSEKKSDDTALQGSLFQPSPETSSAPHQKITSSLSKEAILNQSSDNQVVGLNNPMLFHQNLSNISGAESAITKTGTPSANTNSGMKTISKISDSISVTNLANQFLAGASAPSSGENNQPLLLRSNQQFESALKQVLQTAQTQISLQPDAPQPQRIAIELQTPPGAIVNVYVSRQNDQWRTQFSTDDPQALAWLQDKMSSLRQANDFGPDVRWLPPQMEGNTFSSGQQQQQNQSRGNPQQTHRASSDDNDENDFMTTLTQIGN